MLKFPKTFTLEEMTVSQTAARHGIDNVPTGKVLENLQYTANCMNLLRMALGDKPIIVSSGYRSPELNKKIGGSSTSAHTQGYAVDFTCPSFGTPLEVAKTIAKLDLFDLVDQLIHEYGAWVHISFDPKNRKQLLTIDKTGTRTGLH